MIGALGISFHSAASRSMRRNTSLSRFTVATVMGLEPDLCTEREAAGLPAMRSIRNPRPSIARPDGVLRSCVPPGFADDFAKYREKKVGRRSDKKDKLAQAQRMKAECKSLRPNNGLTGN